VIHLLEDGDLDAQAVQDVGHLHADVASAHDDRAHAATAALSEVRPGELAPTAALVN